jgi:hypothetical protein
MHADSRRYRNRIIGGFPQGIESDRRQEPVKPGNRLRKYRTSGRELRF